MKKEERIKKESYLSYALTFLVGAVLLLAVFFFARFAMNSEESSYSLVNEAALEKLSEEAALNVKERIDEVNALQKAYDQAVADKEALYGWLSGSHLIPGEVSYELTDEDIPYLRKLFSNCIVIGNSRAKNAVDCGIMTEKEVKYMSGVSCTVIHDFAMEQAKLYAPKTLFVMGLNDIGYYDGSNEKFYQAYKLLVTDYMKANPGSTVYLQEILPCPEEARPFFYRFFMIPDFNARIRQVCEETGAIYVSATPYADFKYINSHDHAHYGKEFYFLWAQTIGNQMHLWEDEAGLDYEIDWEAAE